MDQVILYLGESLKLFQREEEASLLTSSMINNYVKNGLIPHPDKKKYTKEHLAGLMAVCMLKQVLSIQDIKTLLTGWEITAETYELFRGATPRRSRKLAGALEETCCTKSDLKQAALLLAVEATPNGPQPSGSSASWAGSPERNRKANKARVRMPMGKEGWSVCKQE